MEAIVLAGGLGTRLRETVPETPKPMAPIGARPFLAYLVEYLADQGVNRAILSVGYRHEQIVSYFGDTYVGMKLVYCIENSPLGTGGAIRKAMRLAADDTVFILNGDTFAAVDYRGMRARHQAGGTGISMALKAVSDVSRYGRVEVTDGRVVRFQEKTNAGSGLINVGVYMMRADLLDAYDLPEKFSFEQDFLHPHLVSLLPSAFIMNNYFIDIGVPEDYRRAQTELPERFEKADV